ncbi:MAG: tRNA (guanosine(37)-N1)-methyltransferase TrmD [Alphaproteobacteria bacterium]
MTGNLAPRPGPWTVPEPWTVHVLTLYPEMFPGPLGSSLAGRALEQGIWALETVDIRAFARDKHRSVDDTPAGGGPGMVMRADVVATALDETRATLPKDRPILCPSPRGQPFDQRMARSLTLVSGALFLCGRFEGIDQRLFEARPVMEVSLGDFVLSGGELPAMAMMDAVVRLLPGVMGDGRSGDEESFETGLLEYPHYTRPAEWEGLAIPEVLGSGHHGRIAEWRRDQAETITRRRRPDLWMRHRDRVRLRGPNKKR